ncbi:MAG: hypothetical protein ACI85I_002921 [Arenicella sp.]|jgi:hypothetical protein
MKNFLLTFLFIGGFWTHSASARPQITFFSQLQAHELEAFFTDTVMLQQLQNLNASVIMGMVDFHEDRAKTIELLNSYNIPVTAWLLLSKEDDYFFHANNSGLAKERYADFKKWNLEKKLGIQRIGIGIEPDLEHLKKMEDGSPNAWLAALRKVNQEGVYGEVQYQALVSKIQSDSFEVESYIYPYLLESESEGIRKLAGLIQVNTDKEIPMIFSSHTSESKENLIESYARTHQLQSIGIGSTGGDFSVHGIKKPKSLNWKETSEDLQTAYNFANDIYLFSLEGCQRQNMLEKLLDLEWKKEKLIAKSISFLASAPSSELGFILNFQPLDHPFISIGVCLLIFALFWVAVLRVLKRFFG